MYMTVDVMNKTHIHTHIAPPSGQLVTVLKIRQ